MTVFQRTRRGALFASLGIGWLLAAAPFLRINTTASMPLGLWGIASPAFDLSRGSAVLTCLPEKPSALGLQRGYLIHGECPGDVEAALKRVAAVAGDTVTVAPGGLSVNGIALPGTVPRERDSNGLDLQSVPAGTYTVEPGTVWLTGGSPKSYDSRYFGAVPIVGIRGLAFPIITQP